MDNRNTLLVIESQQSFYGMDAAVLEIFCLLPLKEKNPQGRNKCIIFFFIAVFRFVYFLILSGKAQELNKNVHREIVSLWKQGEKNSLINITMRYR